MLFAIKLVIEWLYVFMYGTVNFSITLLLDVHCVNFFCMVSDLTSIRFRMWYWIDPQNHDNKGHLIYLTDSLICGDVETPQLKTPSHTSPPT